jgi:serine/threonine protein kinase
MAPEILSVAAEIDEYEKDEQYKYGRNKEELHARLERKGYGLECDVFSAGVLFAQLLFSVPEENITDDDNLECKHPRFRERCQEELSKLESRDRRYSESDCEPESSEVAEGTLLAVPEDSRSAGNGTVESVPTSIPATPERFKREIVGSKLAYRLCLRMLDEVPETRISVEGCLDYAYFNSNVFPPLSPRFAPLYPEPGTPGRVPTPID